MQPDRQRAEEQVGTERLRQAAYGSRSTRQEGSAVAVAAGTRSAAIISAIIGADRVGLRVLPFSRRDGRVGATTEGRPRMEGHIRMALGGISSEGATPENSW